YKFSIESKRLPPSLSGEPFFCFYIIKPQSHTNVIKHVNWHLPFYRQENKEYINKKKTNTQTRK
ncbi:hypothetical protein, partial [Prevotella sp.]|uniref:hypothetical protein n=1 Tax=Prevotella sp. TaxID=59823 RepID=UPI00307BF29F